MRHRRPARPRTETPHDNHHPLLVQRRNLPETELAMLHVVRGEKGAAVERRHKALIAGTVDPQERHALSL